MLEPLNDKIPDAAEKTEPAPLSSSELVLDPELQVALQNFKNMRHKLKALVQKAHSENLIFLQNNPRES